MKRGPSYDVMLQRCHVSEDSEGYLQESKKGSRPPRERMYNCPAFQQCNHVLGNDLPHGGLT